MTLIYLIRSLFTQKNFPYLLNDSHIYNRFLLTQKNFPYLLNDSYIYYRSLFTQKISLVY